MNTLLILLRGINVGGKNKISMKELKRCLTKHGFENVSTYIQSGNVILQTKDNVPDVSEKIEALLERNFKLDTKVKALVLTIAQLQSIIDNKPSGFGEQPENYHSDVVFLMDIDANHALSVFSPKEGVDKVWAGSSVIYSQRLSAQRTKSRLAKIVGTPQYKSMTIRNWNTTTKLLTMLKELDIRKNKLSLK